MSILTKPTPKKVWVTYVNNQYGIFFCGFFPNPIFTKEKLGVLVIYIYIWVPNVTVTYYKLTTYKVLCYPIFLTFCSTFCMNKLLGNILTPVRVTFTKKPSKFSIKTNGDFRKPKLGNTTKLYRVTNIKNALKIVYFNLYDFVIIINYKT